ncbi:MAG: Coenzyme F420 hydrogenase/dehydrogenase, beta subunit C-terminal domain [Bacteroidales bacterium]|nr:Coenzyme F420 hydrogenase/dehydrogenase, beta subunit C-terminal domain [Bacteroidales bacterium]
MNIVPTEDCTGCSACLNSCPIGCIVMSADVHGFRYPHVDRSSCINCGKCVSVCPVRNNRPSDPTSLFYGCKHVDDEVRRHSSSGGLFYELARTVIMSGGVVFGAAFSEDYHKVVHVQASTLEELEPIRVSKYVQSEVDSSFPLVKAALGRGQMVLFSGTPCQIAGVKSYIGEVPDNLILAEVVCHGVPSPKVWDIYLSGLEKDHGSKVNFVSFRDKSKSWRKSDFLARFENGSVFSQPNSENPYMKAFLKNLSLRPSCTRCSFKRFISGADITLGDFWGSSELGNSYKDDVGISVVALNTPKGLSCFDSVKDNLTDVVKLSEKQAFIFNDSYRESAESDEHAYLFFSDIDQKDFLHLVSEMTVETERQQSRKKIFLSTVVRRLKSFFE